MSDLADMNEFNRGIIEQFRANEGKVGPPFEGAPLLILHSTGAKSGKTRLAPIVFQAVGHSWAVFASKAGAPDNPDWFHNVRANPRFEVEVGTETFDVDAEVLTREERAEVWPALVAEAPGFGGYQDKTERIIPGVRLRRVS